MENKFADRIGNIMISNGIARLDFLTLKEVHQDTNKADFELAFRLNIPVDGIMQAADMLEKMKVDLMAQQDRQNQQTTEIPAEIEESVSEQPRKKLTRKEFEQLSPEQQKKIRQRAKQNAKRKEQEKIRQQLER